MCWGGGDDLKPVGPGGWKGERAKRRGGMGTQGEFLLGGTARKGQAERCY